MQKQSIARTKNVKIAMEEDRSRGQALVKHYIPTLAALPADRNIRSDERTMMKCVLIPEASRKVVLRALRTCCNMILRHISGLICSRGRLCIPRRC